MLQSADVIDELRLRAEASSSGVDTSRRGQITSSVGALAASSSLAYYLGTGTNYFASGARPTEIPIYVAFSSLAALAAKELLNICGRREPKTLAAGVLTGSATGLGTALGFAGLAFTLATDVALGGTLTVVGGAVGYLLTRRGKKVHSCGARLPCDTWICSECSRIIAPSADWSRKDKWSILDVCDYLYTGGLEWNVVKSVAFMNFSGLMLNASRLKDSPVLWNPGDVRKAALDDVLVAEFVEEWDSFARHRSKGLMSADFLLDDWEKIQEINAEIRSAEALNPNPPADR